MPEMTDSQKLLRVRGLVALMQRHAVEARIPATTSTTTGVAGRCEDILGVVDHGWDPPAPSACFSGEGTNGPCDWRGLARQFLEQERGKLTLGEATAVERFLGIYRG